MAQCYESICGETPHPIHSPPEGIMLVLRAAHFWVCSICGLHGHIVFSDESRTDELRSQFDALTEAGKGWQEGRLHELELAPLCDSILNSPLPPILEEDSVNLEESLDSQRCGTAREEPTDIDTEVKELFARMRSSQ